MQASTQKHNDPSPGRASTAAETTPLAVWLQVDAVTARLPPCAARSLIEHYSDPGDLILTDDTQIAREACRLNRRADKPTERNHSHRDAGVRRLPQTPAQLALITPSNRRVRGVEDTARRLLPQLKLGGFLILDVPPAAGALGTLVRSLQEIGASYWQHIVVADAQQIEESLHPWKRSGRIELRRSHRDLLVFRQPTDPAAAAAGARECAKAVAA